MEVTYMNNNNEKKRYELDSDNLETPDLEKDGN
jgi:hypothetical protein